MAEFPDLGAPCTKCNTNDFLPFVCVYCKEIYCKEHREAVTGHNCSSYKEVNNIVLEKPDEKRPERCSFCRQIVRNAMEMVVCDKCEVKHCLGHRHPESHECAKLKEEKLRVQHSLRTQPQHKPVAIVPGVKGIKNDALAKKVAFMKLKQKAKGLSSIPQTERVYVNITIQAERSEPFQAEPFHFSKEWSFGRCVDWLSTELRIKNQNNLASAPKLVIGNEARDIEAYELSFKLKEAIENGTLADADLLILKYMQK